MVNEYLKELKNSNELENEVLDYYIDNNYNSFDELLSSMEDVSKYGCVSGIVPSLIYYDDTVDFYDRHKDDINTILSDVTFGTGLSVAELFGDKYDKEDPLNLDYYSKNLLSWFGFEETSNRLYSFIYEKVKQNNLELNY